MDRVRQRNLKADERAPSVTPSLRVVGSHRRTPARGSSKPVSATCNRQATFGINGSKVVARCELARHPETSTCTGRFFISLDSVSMQTEVKVSWPRQAR